MGMSPTWSYLEVPINNALYVGTVVENAAESYNDEGTKKYIKRGRIKVTAAPFENGPEWVSTSSPVAGLGAGLFAIPSIGTKVLIAEVYLEGGFTQWVWFSSLWDNSVIGKEKDQDADDGKDLAINTNIPEIDKIYEYSNTPDQYIFKSPFGHKLVLSDKVTKDLNDAPIQQDYVLLESADGKKLLLDDGIGEQFSRILLADESRDDTNKAPLNFLLIQTGDDGDAGVGANGVKLQSGAQLQIESKKGKVFITVGAGSSSPLEIVNYGEGDVNIESRTGDINIKSAKEVNITSSNASNITLDAGVGEVHLKGSNIVLG
tara:strand:- start:9245 stop:10198 length:954 start_codon:yes stop_codon:yes gene_type:complete